MIPSAEQVANTKPCDLGANFTSVTLVLESTRFVRRTQRLTGDMVGELFSPTVSSHTETVRSKEHVAKTCPNSGWAQDRRQTDPECAFQLAVTLHTPVSLWSQTYGGDERKCGISLMSVPTKLQSVMSANLHVLITGTSGHPLSIVVVCHIVYYILVLRMDGLILEHFVVI